MGIPSPINGPIASPLMKLKTPMSPELPLHAVQELDNEQACDLLPPSTVDLVAACGRILPLKPTRTWADAKDSVAEDSTDEPDNHSESSTGLPRADSNSNDSIESRAEPSLEEQANATEEASLVSTGRSVFEEKGVMKVDLYSLMPYPEAPCDTGTIMQLLCRIYRDGKQGMSVVPCMGDDIAPEGEHEVFWCYVQQQQDGSVLITPCTDPTACGIFVDAAGVPLESATETLGAPKRPAQGSHIPMWIYGSRAPFNVAPTTLILSNLPTDLTQEDFIEILDKEGYSGFYDFAYLPSDADHKHTKGYAIVNLTRHEYGLALSALMHDRTSWCGAESGECQVTWSIPLQGISQIKAHFKDHEACQDSVPEELRPTFFSGGWPQPFPLAETPTR